MPKIANFRIANSANLKQHYKRHEELNRSGFQRMAVTPGAAPIPRWMLFEKVESAYREEILGQLLAPNENAAKLPSQSKLEILAKVFGDKEARSGVLFIEQFEAFQEDKLNSIIDKYKPLNLSNIELHFLVSGIVQKCGTRGAFERLFNLVRLNPSATIAVHNQKDPDLVSVKITGDLFSAILFQGLIRPDSPQEPRIFHGIDIGRDFSPHNLIIAALSLEPINLRMGMHMYTINIEQIKDVKLFEPGTYHIIKINKEIHSAIIELRNRTQKFISGL